MLVMAMIADVPADDLAAVGEYRFDRMSETRPLKCWPHVMQVTLMEIG